MNIQNISQIQKYIFFLNIS